MRKNRAGHSLARFEAFDNWIVEFKTWLYMFWSIKKDRNLNNFSLKMSPLAFASYMLTNSGFQREMSYTKYHASLYDHKVEHKSVRKLEQNLYKFQNSGTIIERKYLFLDSSVYIC